MSAGGHGGELNECLDAGSAHRKDSHRSHLPFLESRRQQWVRPLLGHSAHPRGARAHTPPGFRPAYRSMRHGNLPGRGSAVSEHAAAPAAAPSRSSSGLVVQTGRPAPCGRQSLRPRGRTGAGAARPPAPSQWQAGRAPRPVLATHTRSRSRLSTSASTKRFLELVNSWRGIHEHPALLLPVIGRR